MEKTSRGSAANLFLAAGAGALLMYLFDPQRGRRRMALARDQLVRLRRTSRALTDVGLRDLSHRASGLVAQLRGAARDETPGDNLVVERVRAQLGRLVSHPHAIHVACEQGRVILTGPILRREERQLIQGVKHVRGVHEVESRLDVHETDDRVPALQGGKRRFQPRAEFMQENWAPGPRLLAIAAGVGLASFGMARRGLGGMMLGLVGTGLAARGASNRDVASLVGLSHGTRGWDAQKTIHVAAPPEKVFDVWSNCENFPRFMSSVEEVRAIDQTRTHWVVKGPAGVPVEWDALVTEHIRPHALAWRSVAGSPVQHSGIVRFDPDAGGTRVTVRLSYHPPAGALGHTLATLFGRDPKRHLDEDLMRMKSFIETGSTPHDAAAPGANVTPLRQERVEGQAPRPAL